MRAMWLEPDHQVVVARPPVETISRQRLPYFVGVSGATAGDGLRAEYGHHPTGRREPIINEAGDVIFIAPDTPHQPINLSAAESARALVARNDLNEQERVVLCDPTSERVSAVALCCAKAA